jgi:hypothetical protein
MKSFYILGLAISLISLAHAQDANPESNLDAEQIQKSIDEFNRNKKSKEAEVTVVLPPPNETETNSRAVPVEEPKTIVIPETPEPSNVRVESIRSGTGKIDPKNIEIKSSFPTKARHLLAGNLRPQNRLRLLLVRSKSNLESSFLLKSYRMFYLQRPTALRSFH